MHTIPLLANASEATASGLMLLALPVILILGLYLRRIAKLTRINYSAAEMLAEQQTRVEIEEYINRNGGALVRQLLKSEGDGQRQLPGGDPLLEDFDIDDDTIVMQPLPNADALEGEYSAMEAIISMEEEMEGGEVQCS